MQVAYSYHRFSKPKQATKDKLWQQYQEAQKYAKANGLVLDESLSFQDIGVSAYRSANLEVGRLGEFLEAIRAGCIEKGSYLLIESLDRLSRDAPRKALRTLEEICDEGITVVTLIDNQEYTADRLDRDPAAFLISLVIFLRANEESKTKSARSRAAYANKLERAARGEKVIVASKLPAWLKFEGDEIVIDQEKVKSIKLIYNLADLGLKPLSIARALNLQKIPTMRGGRYWRGEAVRLILTKPSTIGVFLSYYRHKAAGSNPEKNFISIKDYYPRVISQRKWKRVQAKIKRSKLKPESCEVIKCRKIRNIFGRIARCPNCGDAMTAYNLGPSLEGLTPHRRYLTCSGATIASGCKRVRVEYAPVEKTFLELGPDMMHNHLAEYVQSKIHNRYNIISAQIKEITRIAGKNELDRGRLNHNLRRLFDRVVINYGSMMLEFEWSCGGRTGLPINESTHISRIGAFIPGQSAGNHIAHQVPPKKP